MRIIEPAFLTYFHTEELVSLPSVAILLPRWLKKRLWPCGWDRALSLLRRWDLACMQQIRLHARAALTGGCQQACFVPWHYAWRSRSGSADGVVKSCRGLRRGSCVEHAKNAMIESSEMST